MDIFACDIVHQDETQIFKLLNFTVVERELFFIVGKVITKQNSLSHVYRLSL